MSCLFTSVQRVGGCRRRRLLIALGSLPLGALAQPSAGAPRRIDIAGGPVLLHPDGAFDAGSLAEAEAWVQRSAAAVAGYLGRFPVSAARVRIEAFDGVGVRGGRTLPEPEPHIRVRLGLATTRAQLLADWVMVHEMIHLAIPQVPRSQNWLHEGLATYVEGIARARAGLTTAAAVWREWAGAMHQGLPQAGDRGLDHTHTWGRTYWGGALFNLLADLRMRERSAGRLGLQQALQGVHAAGGHYGVAWPVARILAVGDAAIGQDAWSGLYADMKDRPVEVDLPALWRDLGVGRGGQFDDQAPRAALRRAILS